MTFYLNPKPTGPTFAFIAAAMAKNRIKWNAHKFHAALVEIAAGHNDPRALATEVLAGLES